MIVSEQQLEQVLHGNSQWHSWLEPVQTLLPVYNVDTEDRLAMFFAQCGHESLNFTVLEENLNYSAKGLNAVFPKYFKNAGRNADDYARQPQKIANVVYANRMGNGPEESNDGWRHRGAGVIQLTGKNNHSAFATSINKPLGDALEYLRTKMGALESAGWFWAQNRVNLYADKQDIRGATKAINGGYIGIEDRTYHYHRVKKILGGAFVAEARPILLKVGASGPEVELVQRVVKITADGVFGKLTEAAVIAWQATHNLTPDGIVGPKTFAAMAATT